MEVRDLRLPIDASNVPKHWLGGKKSVTHFLDGLSVLFPPGERFFVVSVKAQSHHVRDAKLQDEVRVFCGQEGCHLREHARYNRMLAGQGYPVAAMERRVERLLRVVMWLLPRLWWLAATCALEHFTALMAHHLLSRPGVFEGAHPQMERLWRWHAAEENEHKAVAFDVYRAAGGGWLVRCLVMLGATVIFWAKVLEHQVRLMWSDGVLFSVREWAQLSWHIGLGPDGLWRLLPHYLAYFSFRFHPWQLDNRDLLEKWKAAHAPG
jgi:uncharacterized protein